MSDTNQVSLPENFYDITSPLLLSQPRPQYLYATAFLSALGASLRFDEPEADQYQSPGGVPYAGPERDRLMMASPLMTGIHAAAVDFDGLPGTSMRFNRPRFVDTTYTEASREIGLNTTISTQTINAGSEQVNLTLKRLAGPYDQTNSRVAPYGIDQFSARLGIHKLSEIVKLHLVDDFHKTIESIQCSLFDSASVVVRPTGMSADNDATVAGQFPMDYDTVNRAELAADEANLPVFPDGYRALVITPAQASQLKLDQDFMGLSSSHAAYNGLFPQYLATVNRLHVFKSTSLNRVNNGSGVPVHRAHLLAPGVGLAGMGAAPRIAPSKDDNYGEAAKLIWVAYLAQGLADNRFCVSIRTA